MAMSDEWFSKNSHICPQCNQPIWAGQLVNGQTNPINRGLTEHLCCEDPDLKEHKMTERRNPGDPRLIWDVGYIDKIGVKHFADPDKILVRKQQ
jgi:hypothetical protein